LEADLEFRYSDDGEPSGTAGRPIQDAILSHKLSNVLVVVTRYFGAPGAAILLILFVWWNRAYLAPLWRATGMSCQEIQLAAARLWRGRGQHHSRMPETTEA
jgi:hypothetical protein